MIFALVRVVPLPRGVHANVRELHVHEWTLHRMEMNWDRLVLIGALPRGQIKKTLFFSSPPPPLSPHFPVFFGFFLFFFYRFCVCAIFCGIL